MAIQPTNNNVVARVDVSPRAVGGAEVAGTPRPAAAPVQPSALVQQPDAVPEIADLERALKNINKVVQAQTSDLEFSIDPDSDRTVVKLVDRQTKEVLRQIPSEEMLSIAKALDQVTGLLIRQKA